MIMLGIHRLFEELPMGSNAVHGDRTAAYSIDHEQIRSQVTFGEASPVDRPLLETMLVEFRRQTLPLNLVSKTCSNVSRSNSGLRRARL